MCGGWVAASGGVVARSYVYDFGDSRGQDVCARHQPVKAKSVGHFCGALSSITQQ